MNYINFSTGRLIILITILFFFTTGCLTVDKVTEQGIVETKANAEPVIIYEGESTTYLPLLKTSPDHNIFGVQLETVTEASGLVQMVQAKSGWTRRDFLWGLVEPVEGQRNWDAVKSYEDELITAVENNITMIPILVDTPDWAAAKPNCRGKVKPEKLQALANFVHDFVKRYSQSPYNVKYIELWNEPDVDNFLGCWGDSNDLLYYGGEYYGQMLKVVYPAAKAANPSIQMLVGGLLLDCDPALTFENKTCTPAYFLKGILQSGAGDSFDGVAFHVGDYFLGELGKYENPNFGTAWNTTGPVTTAKANFLRGLLAEFNVKEKILLVTEAGIKCGYRDELADRCLDPIYGFEETKAYYLVQDGAAALAGGYEANIWYSVYGDSFSGFLDRNNNEPFPAYHAFKFMRSKLANHTYVRSITEIAGVMGYEFQSSSGRKLWVVWSLDGQTHVANLAVIPSSVDKISSTGEGSSLPVGETVEIGIAPVFIGY